MAPISRRAFLRRVVVGTGALTLFQNGGWEYANAAADPTIVFTLRILHVNDHHAHIEPIVETNFTPNRNHGGVSRRQTYIKAARAAAAAAGATTGLLVLDAGDVFQGTLYYNQYKGYADLDFYRRFGLDAITIGNHEFDDGPTNLAKFIDGATTGTYPTPPTLPPGVTGVAPGTGSNFPVISANITVTAGSPLDTRIKPSTIVNVTANGAVRKIGIFGLTTQDTASLSSPGPTVTFGEPVAAANAAIAGLKATPGGVDTIIGLTHVGYDVDQLLGKNITNTPLIIGGHTHTPVGPQPASQGAYPTIVTDKNGEQVLVLTDWEWGRWMGDIVINYDKDGKIISGTGVPVELIADSTKTGYVQPDATIEPIVAVKDAAGKVTAGYAQQIDVIRTTPVGSSTVGLNGTTALVRSQETNLSNLIADAILAKVADDAAKVSYPSVVITNGGGIRASINAGNISYGDVLTVLPFGNTIYRVDLTGALLRQAISGGLDKIGISGNGRFPVIANLRFKYSASLPVGQRLLDLKVKVKGAYVAVDDAATYRIYTNNFNGIGGDEYVAFTKGTNKLDIGFILADAVAEYITKNSPIDNTKIEFGRVLIQYNSYLPIAGTAVTGLVR